MEAIREGEIQVLIVGRYDRFSRIQMQQAIAIYQIEELYGGRVESADQNEQFGKSSTGALLRSINAWRAERELELIRERTQGARRARAQSGKIVPAAVPLYGYVWADSHEKRGKSRYLVDPETAPIIARIFREAVAGVSLRRIAGDLTSDGIPTPSQALTVRGLVAPGRFKNIVEGRWVRQVVMRILKNSAYCGEYVAYRYQVTRETDHERRHIKMRPEGDRARVVLPPEICPAIISKELFQAAQEQLERNKAESIHNNKAPYLTLLRGGFAVCGYCGSTMIARRSTQSYVCCRPGNSGVYNLCPGGHFAIHAPTLDDTLWTMVRVLFRHPERMRAILEAQQAYQDQVHVTEKAGYLAVEGHLAQLKGYLQNATKAVLNAQDDFTRAHWEHEIEGLLVQRAEAREQLQRLEELRQGREGALLYMRSIEEWSRTLEPASAEATYEEKRFLLRGLGLKVTCFRKIHDPRYHVDWNLAGLDEKLRSLLPSLTSQEVASVVRQEAAGEDEAAKTEAFPLRTGGYLPPLVKHTTNY